MSFNPRTAADDNGKAIFFQKSKSLKQEVELVEQTLTRDLWVERLRKVILDVQGKARENDEATILETFQLIVLVRNATFDLVEKTHVWQQAFTKNIRPKLRETDYLVKMIALIEFVSFTLLRKIYNFQLGKNNVFSLPFPALRTIELRKVSSEMAKHIFQFAFPDEDRVVKNYQILANMLPQKIFRTIFAIETWLVNKWKPPIIIIVDNIISQKSHPLQKHDAHDEIENNAVEKSHDPPSPHHHHHHKDRDHRHKDHHQEHDKHNHRLHANGEKEPTSTNSNQKHLHHHTNEHRGKTHHKHTENHPHQKLNSEIDTSKSNVELDGINHEYKSPFKREYEVDRAAAKFASLSSRFASKILELSAEMAAVEMEEEEIPADTSILIDSNTTSTSSPKSNKKKIRLAHLAGHGHGLKQSSPGKEKEKVVETVTVADLQRINSPSAKAKRRGRDIEEEVISIEEKAARMSISTNQIRSFWNAETET